MENATFLAQAAAGLNVAQVILLTYLAIVAQNLKERMQHHDKLMSKVLTRVQRLSIKEGLSDLDVA